MLVDTFSHRRVTYVGVIGLWLVLFGLFVYGTITNNSLLVYLPATLPIGLLILRHPFLGLLTLVFVIPLETAFFTIAPGALSGTRLLGLGVVAAYGVHMLDQKRLFVIYPPFRWFFALFMLAFVSLTWAWDVESASTRLVVFIQMLVMATLLFNEVNSLQRLRIVIGVLMFSCLLVTLLGLADFNRIVENTQTTRLTLTEGQAVDEYVFYVGMLMMASTVQLIHGEARYKRFALVVAALTLLPIIGAGTRQAPLALLIGMSSLLMIGRKRVVSAIMILVASIGFVVVLQYLIDSELINDNLIRRLTLDHVVESRGSGRLDIWIVAGVTLAENPLTGVGFESFPRAFAYYVTISPIVHQGVASAERFGGHNDFVQMAAQLGIPGSILFVGGLSHVLLELLRAIKKTFGQPINKWLIVLFALTTYIIGMSLTSDMLWRKGYWVVLGLGVAAPYIVAFHTKEVSSEAEIHDPSSAAPKQLRA